MLGKDSDMEQDHHCLRSSLKRNGTPNEDRPKVLLVIGDGAEVLDTMYPFYRLGEDYQVVVTAPKRETYHLVIHGEKVTTIPKCRFDAEVCGAQYVADPVVRSGNLLCARGKKDMSAWMQEFVPMIENHLISSKTNADGG